MTSADTTKNTYPKVNTYTSLVVRLHALHNLALHALGQHFQLAARSPDAVLMSSAHPALAHVRSQFVRSFRHLIRHEVSVCLHSLNWLLGLFNYLLKFDGRRRRRCCHYFLQRRRCRGLGLVLLNYARVLLQVQLPRGYDQFSLRLFKFLRLLLIVLLLLNL